MNGIITSELQRLKDLDKTISLAIVIRDFRAVGIYLSRESLKRRCDNLGLKYK